MSTLAAERADSYQRSIIAACDAGAPFGYINSQTDETAEDLDALAQALGLAPRELDDMLTTADRFQSDDDGLASDWPEDQEEPPTREAIMGDWSEASAGDYLSDVLDIRYVVSGREADDYISADIAIAIGGPNIWISTGDKTLTVYWGGEPETRGLPFTFCEQLDGSLAEYWSNGA